MVEWLERDDESGVYYVDFHDTEFETRGVAVVVAVADISGRDTNDLSPLSAAIDPDALEDLFRVHSDGSGPRVTFSFEGHVITVHASGGIAISPPER